MNNLRLKIRIISVIWAIVAAFRFSNLSGKPEVFHDEIGETSVIWPLLHNKVLLHVRGSFINYLPW